MSTANRGIAASVLTVTIAGCTGEPAPEVYTYHDVSAYVGCTDRARSGRDPATVSAAQASSIVDQCEAHLNRAAQALTARYEFEGGEASRSIHPDFSSTRYYRVKRKSLRDVAMCATSVEVRKSLCGTTD